MRLWRGWAGLVWLFGGWVGFFGRRLAALLALAIIDRSYRQRISIGVQGRNEATSLSVNLCAKSGITLYLLPIL